MRFPFRCLYGGNGGRDLKWYLESGRERSKLEGTCRSGPQPRPQSVEGEESPERLVGMAEGFFPRGGPAPPGSAEPGEWSELWWYDWSGREGEYRLEWICLCGHRAVGGCFRMGDPTRNEAVYRETCEGSSPLSGVSYSRSPRVLERRTVRLV